MEKVESYLKISSRVNATNLTERQSAERSTPDLHLYSKKTDSWIREVALFVVLQSVYPRGNIKLRERTRENSLIQGAGRVERGREESLWKTERREDGEEDRETHLPSRSGSLLSSSRSSCRLTTAWFHAKRCFHGAVISFSQRTYDPPPLFLVPWHPLVGSSSVLSLSAFSRARESPLFSSLPISSPFRKFVLNAQFHLHRSVHFQSTSVSFHQGCIAFIPS